RFEFYAVKLFLLCSIVLVLQNIYAPLTSSFSLDSSLFLQQPWTLLTYMFLHANIAHFLSNMFALLVFGSILEKAIGARNFLVVYILSGLAGGAAGLFFYDSMIGASAAILGSMASLALLRPRLVVWVGYVPMPMILALFAWALMDALGVFAPSNVAHMGHLGGMATGVVYTLLFLRAFMEKREKEYKIKIGEDVMREWERRYMGR
ncbi:MAG: rhomboid family intramembrane serine protease, partial [Candidatus Aenigmatarchaeota archaeon]